MRFGAATFFLAMALAAVPAWSGTLVYRVDRVTAKTEGPRLVIVAKGAVRSGGWEHPRLILHKSARDDGGIEIDFVAAPPANRHAVAHSVVPINVSLKLRLPHGATLIRVNAETNSYTMQLAAKPLPERTALR
jgi:hypothetical protein